MKTSSCPIPTFSPGLSKRPNVRITLGRCRRCGALCSHDPVCPAYHATWVRLIAPVLTSTMASPVTERVLAAARPLDVSLAENIRGGLHCGSIRGSKLISTRKTLFSNANWQREGAKVTFNREACQAYLSFATAPETKWRSNFRDVGAAVTRMATLAPSGRINEAVVAEEAEHLRRQWQGVRSRGNERPARRSARRRG